MPACKELEMTKAIRIENADTSNHKVRVYRENKNEAGEWVRGDAVPPVTLDMPTQMLTDYVHSGQRFWPGAARGACHD